MFFQGNGWMNLVMILVGCVFLFLAIKKGFEPYLLIPIAFGILWFVINFKNGYREYAITKDTASGKSISYIFVLY